MGYYMKRLIGDDHVDEMVLRVQQWVNLHYSWHPQYEVIDENGKTGWSTMYALTRALQIELGITKLFDNFGDGTASAYKQWGELELGNIPDDDKGTNIVLFYKEVCIVKVMDPAVSLVRLGKVPKQP